KTRLASLPLTASLFAPGPLIVTLLVMSNSPPVSVIVPCSPLANVMASSPEASPARKEPGPLSLVFRTVKVLGSVRSSSRNSCGRRRGGRWAGRRRGARDSFDKKAANMETSRVDEEATAARNLSATAALWTHGMTTPSCTLWPHSGECGHELF